MTVHRILLAAIVASVLVGVAPEAQGSGTTAITTCATTVTTNAALAGDLVCSGDGIVVGAPGITIDLKGHTIRGDGGTDDYGIDDTGGHDRVTVKNGTIRGFYDGVHAESADGFSVTNVVASGNTVWGIIVFGGKATVASSTASGNAQYGIGVSGGAASIKSSVASGNTFIGLSLVGDSGRITSTAVSGSQYGMSIAGNAVSVKSSTASGNGVAGISVTGDAAKLSGNVADGNGFYGGATDLGGPGIQVQSSVTAPAGHNTARGNDDPDECEPVALC
jgi:hypothetical protein